MTEYSSLLGLPLPALAQNDWKQPEDEVKSILDFVVYALLNRHRIVNGGVVSNGGGLTADYSAYVAKMDGKRFLDTDGGSTVLSAAPAGLEELRFIYVDASGSVQGSGNQPIGDYVPLAAVYVSDTAIMRMADLRPMSAPGGVGENLLLNPAFQVNQDGYTFGTAIGTANKYLLDGWFSDTVNGNITDNGDGTFTVTDLVQIMADREDLDGVTVTIAAEVTDAGSLTVSAGGADSSSDLGTLTEIGSLTSSVVSLTFGLDVGTKTWPVIKLTGSAKFKDLKLEVGHLRTPERRKSHDEDLALCQSQLFKTYRQQDAPGTIVDDGRLLGYNPRTTGSYTIFFQVPFPRAMRAIPTTTIYSTNSGAAGKMYALGPAADVDAGSQYPSESLVTVGNTATISTVGYITCHVVANARP